MTITNEIIENYFECHYKSHLKLKGIQGQKCNLERLQASDTERLKTKYFIEILKTTYNRDYASDVSLGDVMKHGQDHIFNTEVLFDGFKFRCDFLKKIPLKSKFGDFAYIPVLIIPTENIPRKTKILVAGIANALSKIQASLISFAEIICGKKLKSVKIKLNTYLKEFHQVVDLLKRSEQFLFHLNAHCAVCEFSEICREKALKENHLSLLKGITRERIKELNNKGIFSVNQLSYTFRPKRKPPQKENKNKTRSVELQALAIREQKLFVYDMPASLPVKAVEMYLDIEGLPDEGFYYLIGLTIKEKDEVKHYHYWANSPLEELSIVKTLISRLVKYDDFVIYHYGTYETTFLKKMLNKLPVAYSDNINHVLGNCYNILSVLYNHIYFPTYSNSLKEIGRFIGFNWSAKDASGIESIVWRKTWEASTDINIKQKLLIYNEEDCRVLIKLKEIIQDVIESKLEVRQVKDLQKEQKTTFIVNESFFPEMKFINECSYFDYQREKVYTKTNVAIKKIAMERTKKKKSIYDFKPTRILAFKSEVCPQCKGQQIFARKSLSKKIVDLNFIRTGIRVIISQYTSYRYSCQTCQHRFIPTAYPTQRLKIGHHLIVWTIYQHIVNKQGFRQIENNFKELFHLFISGATFFACKDYFIRYYSLAYEDLLSALLKSDVLYVDETPFNMQFEKGYVWVFTNGSEVISIYKSNRESGFLKEYLKDFKGVLVTDFYNGYDALPCPQQKCLIHLIRDFNSDLIRNPFNEEFKTIAKDFTILLQKIVITINRFGLKKYHLNKHQKEAIKFFTKVLLSTYQTEIALQYQTRIKKNQNTLFEFLRYDNVSWNNSNAEHAIKILALHTNKNINAFRKSRIDEYLKIMSIYQSCEYKNISFLKFLLSKKTILNDY